MIGDMIRTARLTAGMTQKELAAQVFVSPQAVSKWERGESEPGLDAIKQMAKIFGIAVDTMLGQKPTSSAGVMVPVLGVVPAGIPIEAIEDILDYEEISPEMAAAGEYFALRIKGSSMEPRIREGDVVIVRQQQDADTGDTAVVMVNGYDATVKRIKKDPDGGLWLLPNNPAFDAQHFSPGEIAGLPVAIIGRVVELRGKM